MCLLLSLPGSLLPRFGLTKPTASAPTSHRKCWRFGVEQLTMWCLLLGMTLLCISASAQNAIVSENALSGNPKSEWDIVGAGDMSIQGFATDMSINRGSTVRFKINVTGGANYSIRIYRLGYYQGNGARRIAELGPFRGIEQPTPDSDTATGLVDCGRWAESASWTIPITAVSGVYLAKLTREDTGGSSHIVFVVRDDQRNAALLFKTSDATWQAYNVYGGNSLYVGSTGYPNGHAVKVSYNRPFVTRSGGGGGNAMEDFLFNAEYPMIRWLERNGFDMVYSTDLDMERDPTPITPARYKALLSVGHDEYWSATERAKFEAARDAGVHLAFFSGNEVYWKTRWENSIDGTNTPYRTLVCYKEGDLGENVCLDKCDPLPDVWTGLWRSGCSFTSADGCKPENALTGQISWVESTGSIIVSDAYKDHPIWRNTSIASLQSGQSVTFPYGTLGYEWDAVEPDYATSNPQGRQVLSSTTLEGRVHELSLYRHSSGALVFGAGTIQWSWGLDEVHDRGNAAPSRDMQQATVNLFSDMGVLPGSLQADLEPGIPANDSIPPVSAFSAPTHNAQLSTGTIYTISGTATDLGGGIVARVEVTTDGGATWQLANGTSNWTYSWTIIDTGLVTLKVRAIDNSGNTELEGSVPSANAITVKIVAGSETFSIWSSTDRPVRDADPDRVPIEVGLKFRPRVNGYIVGVRYYKSTINTGPHIGNLWTSTGVNLARATFVDETASGWQQVLFSTPIEVTAGTTYVASYHTTTGAYSSDEFYFANTNITTPFLEALQDGIEGQNGLYEYSATPAFPTNGYNSTNFWVDVVFSRDRIPDTTPPAVVKSTPTAGATQVPLLSTVTVSFNEPMDASTINNLTVALQDSTGTALPVSLLYDVQNYTLTIKPADTLGELTRYNVLLRATGEPSIKDLAGNALREDYTWSFRTAKAGDESGPFSIWSPSTVPVRVSDPDRQPVEIGVKFRPLVDGFITGIRYYKSETNTGPHTGNLWSRDGTNLARALFNNESTSGWQEVLFDNPVAVTAGTVYVASYHTTTGQYASDYPFFTQPVTTPYLEALRDGEDGPNGLYEYTSATAFPTNGYEASNFWVDVVFRTSIGPDTVPPKIISMTPLPDATGVGIAASISATFSEPIDPATVSVSTVTLKDAGNNALNIAVAYRPETRSVSIVPEEPLKYNSRYTVSIKGTASGIKDRAGNALQQDASWDFFTTAPPPAPPVEGPGGPILVISGATNPFSRYPVEILRAEGLNSFTAMDISTVSSTVLNNYDVVILGEVPLTVAQVNMLTEWTEAGGTLIALKPDAKLAPLLGLTKNSGSLSEGYLAVNTASSPGTGIVSEPIQYHGPADLYTLNGATAVATLYSNATTATVNPAVSSRNVGTKGGQAVAFTYDLARSIVYTRQGNPDWAGQERDGQDGPIRANDMFYGNASGDPKPDWIDFNKIDIPQADEQQRLLANIIIQANLDRKPLPRFWYLPKGLKAAVVMTGDDHANGGTAGRFEQYKALSASNTPEAVADWTAIRGTSYIYPGSPLTNAELTQFQADGFEVALHLNTGCSNFTQSSLTSDWNSQSSTLIAGYPGINPLVTNRTHCMPWNDWATQAKVQAARGVRLDVNYYYWPGEWIQSRPGMFTGSGMPMRFADVDGTIIDCYQVPTQITDESGITDYAAFISALLDKAKGPEGYFGVFCANMHTDVETSQGSDEIIRAAMDRQIPVVSAKQMLDWLDGRNNSSFGAIAWDANQLSFSIAAATGSRNMKGMLPAAAAPGRLTSLTLNGAPVTFAMETIKGIEYAFFDALPGNYVGIYGADCLAMRPTDATTQAFSDAKFTARSNAANVTYQWQVSTDGGSTFTNINNDSIYSGVTDPTLSLTKVPRSFNNYQYRCLMSGECSVTTKPVTLTVNKADQIISWATPEPITYGTALSVNQLNTSVAGVEGGSAPGTPSFSQPEGAVLPAGNQILTVTVSETEDYNPATASVTLVVNQRPVSARVAVADKVYDATTSATISGHTLEGVLLNDEVSLIGATATFANRHSGRNKLVTVRGLGLAGSAAGNYALVNAELLTTATITPLTVNANVTVANKSYSGTTNATILSRTVGGAYPIDTVYIWGGTASFSDARVGNGKTVTASGLRLGGINTGNYLLASSNATTTAAITPKSVSGSITVATKEYDGTDAAEILTASISGVLTADLGKVQLVGGTARFVGSSAGSKRVVATDFRLSGEAAGNYVLTSSTFTASGTILKRPITVTARSGQTKLGGAPDPVFLYDITAGSLVSGENFTGALTRVPGEAAGSYPIIQGTLALTPNYQLTYQGANFIITDPIVSTIKEERSILSGAALGVDPRVVLAGYPNPFSRHATIEFMVPVDEPKAVLGIYDLRGLKIREIYNGKANANQLYRFNLDGSNIPPGAYFIRLTLRSQVENFKIIMLE